MVATVASADMIAISAGSFVMGRDDGLDDERPAHLVTLRAFAIDRMPVTNGEFAEFLNVRGPVNARGQRLYDDDDRDARIHRLGGRWLADPGLALQLHFSFEVSAACVGLMGATPERPCDDACALDAPLSELRGDAADFLD